MEIIPRNITSQDWMVIVFLLAFAMFIIARLRYREYFDHFVRLLDSDKFFKESANSAKRFQTFNALLFIPRMLLVSLGLYYVSMGLGFTQEGSWVLYLKILLLYFVLIVVKFLVEKILGVLFSFEEVLDRYQFFKVTYKNFLSLGLVPFLLIVAYTWQGPPIFYQMVMSLFIILQLLFLLYYYRNNTSIIFSNLFYFILYLCTLEIGPYYILYKIIE